MAVEQTQPPYVQDDGTIIRHYIVDTDAERSSLAALPGSTVFVKETNISHEGSSSSAWQNPVTTQVTGGQPFPVGSVFISVVSTNPSALLGYGTWSAFGAGRVMVGLDGADPSFDVAEETGGAKTSAVSAHSGTAVANHAFTQPSGHSNHVVTQPANHVFTQPAAHSNHVVTQPANHVVTQPSNHSALTTGADSTTSGGTAKAVAQTPSAHAGTAVSAHASTAVDAHSAHASGSVDAHSATAVDAHSAHAGGAVDAHGVTQPTAHADLGVVQPYIVCYFWKRVA